MKKIIVSAVVASFVATSAIAGSLVEPEIAPMVVMEPAEEAGSSSSGIWIPLLGLAALALLIGSSDSSTATTS